MDGINNDVRNTEGTAGSQESHVSRLDVPCGHADQKELPVCRSTWTQKPNVPPGINDSQKSTSHHAEIDNQDLNDDISLFKNGNENKLKAEEQHRELCFLLAKETNINLDAFKKVVIDEDILSQAECSEIKSVLMMFDKLEDVRKDDFGVGKYTFLSGLIMRLHKSSRRTIDKYRKRIEKLIECEHLPLDGTTRSNRYGENISLLPEVPQRLGYQPCPEYKIETSEDGKSGLLIIINQLTEERLGSTKDAENLQKLFNKIGFHVMTYENKSKNDIVELLDGEINERITDNDYSQVFVAIMSHGIEGEIQTVEVVNQGTKKEDRHYMKLEEITTKFSDNKKLIGKPKVFLIEACRGTETLPVDRHLSERSSGQVSTDCPTVKVNPIELKTPKQADVLICYAQVAGYAASRDHIDGSHFIESVYEVFNKNVCHHHVLDMMTMVNKHVADRVYEEDGPKYCQMPCYSSTLRKRLFLRHPDMNNSRCTSPKP